MAETRAESHRIKTSTMDCVNAEAPEIPRSRRPSWSSKLSRSTPHEKLGGRCSSILERIYHRAVTTCSSILSKQHRRERPELDRNRERLAAAWAKNAVNECYQNVVWNKPTNKSKRRQSSHSLVTRLVQRANIAAHQNIDSLARQLTCQATVKAQRRIEELKIARLAHALSVRLLMKALGVVCGPHSCNPLALSIVASPGCFLDAHDVIEISHTNRQLFMVMDAAAHERVTWYKERWPPPHVFPPVAGPPLVILPLVASLYRRLSWAPNFSAGQTYSLLLHDKDVYALGVLPERRASPPYYLPKPLKHRQRITMVACGGDFYFLLCQNGEVRVGGRERYRLMQPWRPDDSAGVLVSAGLSHGFLLSSKGKVYTYTPATFVSHVTRFVAFADPHYFCDICCGDGHALLIDAYRRAWIYYVSGPLPLSSAVELSAPVMDVACGSDHSVFVDDRGRVFGLGRSSEGQLGASSVPRVSKPSIIKGLPRIVRVFSGGAQTLFLDEEGVLYACGETHRGSKHRRPTRQVDFQVAAITSGPFHTIASSISGQHWSWGLHDAGLLGHYSEKEMLQEVGWRQYLGLSSTPRLLQWR
eukprot:GEMP01012813.1.p1 GENE.GEMP01012813.1~~GEMP01012813.1.p1  ORF type:complete len:587 (+),score=116.78 GEMP01012813.1:81-1841(+)